VKRLDVVILAVSIVAIVFTVYVRAPPSLHIIPGQLLPVSYTDIGSIYYRVLTDIVLRSPIKSNSTEGMEEIFTPFTVPYRDYFFEYPPLVAALFYVALMLSSVVPKIGFAPWSFASVPLIAFVAYGYVSVYLVRRRYLSKQFLVTVPLVALVTQTFAPHQVAFFLTMSLVLVVLLGVAQTSALRLAEHLGTKRFGTVWAVLSPSLLYFTVYNFDIILVAFLLLGLEYYVVHRRENLGLLLMGASVAAKLLPLLGVALLVIASSRSLHDFVRRALYAISIPVASLALAVAVAGLSIINAVTYLSNFMCENCLWLPITKSYADPLSRKLFIATYVTSTLLLLYIVLRHLRRPTDRDVVKLVMLGVFPATIFNYIFPPQFVSSLVPTALVLEERLLPLFVVADIINVIATYVCVHLNAVGSGCFVWPSDAQKLFLARNILLLVLFIAAVSETLRSVAPIRRVSNNY